MLEELFELEWEEITDCLDEIETLSDFAEQVEEEKSFIPYNSKYFGRYCNRDVRELG